MSDPKEPTDTCHHRWRYDCAIDGWRCAYCSSVVDSAHMALARFYPRDGAPALREDPPRESFSSELVDAMNGERWEEATHLLIAKVDAGYRERATLLDALQVRQPAIPSGGMLMSSGSRVRMTSPTPTTEPAHEQDVRGWFSSELVDAMRRATCNDSECREAALLDAFDDDIWDGPARVLSCGCHVRPVTEDVTVKYVCELHRAEAEQLAGERALESVYAWQFGALLDALQALTDSWKHGFEVEDAEQCCEEVEALLTRFRGEKTG